MIGPELGPDTPDTTIACPAEFTASCTQPLQEFEIVCAVPSPVAALPTAAIVTHEFAFVFCSHTTVALLWPSNATSGTPAFRPGREILNAAPHFPLV